MEDISSVLCPDVFFSNGFPSRQRIVLSDENMDGDLTFTGMRLLWPNNRSSHTPVFYLLFWGMEGGENGFLGISRHVNYARGIPLCFYVARMAKDFGEVSSVAFRQLEGSDNMYNLYALNVKGTKLKVMLLDLETVDFEEHEEVSFAQEGNAVWVENLEKEQVPHIFLKNRRCQPISELFDRKQKGKGGNSGFEYKRLPTPMLARSNFLTSTTTSPIFLETQNTIMMNSEHTSMEGYLSSGTKEEADFFASYTLPDNKNTRSCFDTSVLCSSVIGNSDGRVEFVFDVTQQKPPEELSDLGEPIRQICITPEGFNVIALQDCAIVIMNMKEESKTFFEWLQPKFWTILFFLALVFAQLYHWYG